MKHIHIRLIALISLIGIVCLFAFGWWSQAIKPVNPQDTEPVIFVVGKGEGVRSIADNLYKEELIRSPVAFFLLARFSGLDAQIQAGDFRLNPSMDIQTLADALTHGSIDVWITIPEGWRREEIAVRLTQELGIPEKEFLQYAKEGYMFPDTYLFPKDATAAAVVDIFLANFNKKVQNNTQAKAQEKGFTLDEVVTIASLVEREAKFADDRPLVASVILNRLKQDMKLDIDATVQYILGYQANEKTWWKKNLTLEDLYIDSPYNTYQHAGLPPGPIANPGLAAINAVFDAPETNYLYYISDANGKIHPAETLEGHNENIAKYLNR